MTLATIGLGANLGAPAAQLQAALERLRTAPEIHDLRCSGFLRSSAIGPGVQPDYCNAVAEFETTADAPTTLALLHRIEAEMGRRRGGARWSARCLDLDLLQFGEVLSATPALQLPHPRIRERAFVLQPWVELNPNARLVPDGATVAAAWQALDQAPLPRWKDGIHSQYHVTPFAPER